MSLKHKTNDLRNFSDTYWIKMLIGEMF